MRNITRPIVLSALLFVFGASLHAQIYSKLENIDDFLDCARNIVIVESLPSDEDPQLAREKSDLEKLQSK